MSVNRPEKFLLTLTQQGDRIGTIGRSRRKGDPATSVVAAGMGDDDDDMAATQDLEKKRKEGDNRLKTWLRRIIGSITMLILFHQQGARKE